MVTDDDFTYDPNDPELIAHERTYHAVNVLVRWTMVGVAAALTTLVLWFATQAGFLGGVIGGLVVLALGWYALVRRAHARPLDPFAPH